MHICNIGMMLRTVARRLFASTPVNSLRATCHNFPGPNKQNPKGEDAHFIGPQAIAVADGVGGWAEIGVDPSRYANELMKGVATALTTLPEDDRLKPLSVLKFAGSKCSSVGSSTCSLFLLDPLKPVAYTANIGDSGYIVYRPLPEARVHIVGKSEEVLHGFNFPFQMGTDGDDPSKAKLLTHDLETGDLVVMFTDGFSDNVHEDQAAALVTNFLTQKGRNIEELAKSLATKAYEQSRDKKFASPFALRAKQEGYQFLGGKKDDITVVVAEVTIGKKT